MPELSPVIAPSSYAPPNAVSKDPETPELVLRVVNKFSNKLPLFWLLDVLFQPVSLCSLMKLSLTVYIYFPVTCRSTIRLATPLLLSSAVIVN